MTENTLNLKDLPNHHDERGSIQMILENCSIGSISRIDSKPGTTRARHYHPFDTHYIEVLVGEVYLYERPVGSQDCPKLTVVKPGEIAFTPAGIEHEMYFENFTVFNCYSLLKRTSENYENQTIRFSYSLKDIYDSFPYKNG